MRTPKLMNISEGEKGIEETLYIMSDLVQEGKTNIKVRNLATKILRDNDIGQKDYDGEVEALFSFVRDNVRYTKDIHGVEFVQHADTIIDVLAGDCDDKAILLSSLLESVGYATRLVAGHFKSQKGFSHVWIQVLQKNEWVDLDATEDVGVGWSPDNVIKYLILEN